MAVVTEIRHSTPTPTPLPPRPRASANRVAAWGALIVVLGAAIWSVADLEINIASMVQSLGNAADFTSRVFPLDFPPLGELLVMTGQTLAIVVVATVLAVLLSLPVAIFAASNTTSGPVMHGAARIIIVLSRAVPDLIFAIIFFRLFGLGALPGILALGLHSIGMIGKLYADAIEELDGGPAEAVRATGGSRVQWITSTVIPQLMPQLIATALHRFDINLRTSVLLGYVGVGGIGLELANALRTMQYQRGMALALIILLLCIGVEMLSGAVRARLLGRVRPGRGGARGFIDRIAAGWITAPRGGREPQRTRAGRIRIAPQWDSERIRRFAGVGLTVAIVALATLYADLNFSTLLKDLLAVPQLMGIFLPPSPQDLLGTLLESMLVTIQIGLAATLLGLVLALPIGILAARNVAPSARVANLFRTIIVVIRGLPELILAIVFIVITGLGPIPGTLALAIGSVGLLGKLVADSLEETDVRVQDAVRATGATGSQVFYAATLRQAMPQFIAHILYQLDVNIRSATLLGIVGAGGIGFYLLNASRVQAFDVVSFIIVMVLVTVLAVEALAVWTRRTLR
ncbi:phosphonate ABC transporter, permease protein PhnE [Cryobacterium frigoriphilum]|uniref:Phosphonate ABC transporter, permease protein PhnE n=1 Tax=Cryobacterium frigoriphilum TaxID=1259150 RepID=A0A4R8ZU44_9MICO|nr:phosphonate ABC transporter, permease protein PhnE [Cryobacterium frigoriphilum]TFD45958.1 phosphonate ABC transporter, permease protein PhnE [Cryobacterium frigoriphilum]